MPDALTSALDRIRTDIEDTVAVYNLDGPGKNSYPISAAMSLHARSLLAAIERVLELHHPVEPGAGAQCKGCATHVTFTRWPCKTYLAITAELAKGESHA